MIKVIWSFSTGEVIGVLKVPDGVDINGLYNQMPILKQVPYRKGQNWMEWRQKYEHEKKEFNREWKNKWGEKTCSFKC